MSSKPIIKRYDLYLAGPFFTDQQKATMDRVKALCEKVGFIVADPRQLGPVIVDTPDKKKTPEFFKKIFDGNIDGMDESRFILACLEDKDIGTSFELGFMYCSGKPIISFNFGEGKTNVMLGQAVDFHASTFEALEEFLETNIKNYKEDPDLWVPNDLSKAASDQ